MKYNLYIVHTLTQIHLNDAEDRINKTIFSRFLHNFHQTAWVLIPVHTEDNAIHGYHSPFYPISKSYVLKKNNKKKDEEDCFTKTILPEHCFKQACTANNVQKVPTVHCSAVCVVSDTSA